MSPIAGVHLHGLSGGFGKLEETEAELKIVLWGHLVCAVPCLSDHRGRNGRTRGESGEREQIGERGRTG